MRAFVIIATKGRAREVLTLMNFLQRQTLPATFTVIVGTEEADIAGVNSHAFIKQGSGVALISPRAGLTSQRNYGFETLEQRGFFTNGKEEFFCAFFDDDFRMADDWLEQARKRFEANDIVGMTGMVLGDGVNCGGYSEDRAVSLLKGEMPPDEHWSSGTQEHDVGSAYGCNMAFVGTVLRNLRFDENVPFHGWQEDRDYTGGAKKFGRVIYFPGCRGVHLGTQSGVRTLGEKFGYSQIANPIYFMKKGTMDTKSTVRFVSRALASNIVHSLFRQEQIDYRGRLRGNILAVIDLLSMTDKGKPAS
jgi:GT2 family glycosyltransferase